MNELRWILLAIGLVMLVLIYLFSRRTSEDDEAELPGDRRYEPTLTRDEQGADAERIEDYNIREPDDAVISEPSSRFASAPEAAQPESELEPEPDVQRVDRQEEHRVEDTAGSVAAEASAAEPPQENAPAPPVPEKVIALHLLPKNGEVFEGVEFVGALQAEGLKFGRFDIFHRYADPGTASDDTPSLFSLANMIKPGTFSLHDLERQQFKGASMFLVLPGPEDAVAAFADMLATGRRLAVTLNGQLLDAQGTQLSRQSASHLREDIINYQHGLSVTPAE